MLFAPRYPSHTPTPVPAPPPLSHNAPLQTLIDRRPHGQADIDRDYVADTFGLKTFPTLVMLPKAGGAPIRYPSDRRDVDTMRMWVKSVAGTA